MSDHHIDGFAVVDENGEVIYAQPDHESAFTHAAYLSMESGFTKQFDVRAFQFTPDTEEEEYL